MFRKNTGFCFALFLFCVLAVAVSSLPVLADSDVITVPDDYFSIQEAINHALPGDTVFVKSGIYNENVVVTKNNLRVVGENKDTTIINGTKTGTVVRVEANSTELSNFTIQNSGDGLTDSGIYLNNSFYCLFYDNKVTGNNLGIYLSSSSNCTLKNNSMNGNEYNFGVSGRSLDEFIHDIDSSNVVDGKPVLYLINEASTQISADAGYVGIVNCTKVTVENLDVTKNWQGILFAYTTDSNIENVTLSSNMDALWIIGCSNCSVYENIVKENSWGGIAIVDSSQCVFEANNVTGNVGYGIFLSDSSNNSFYHNNLDNTNQVWLFGVNSNSWDAGEQMGGNYWSDYTGTDSNGDSIGDTPYVIGSNNSDGYPLMQPYVVSSETDSTTVILYWVTGIVVFVALAVVFALFLKHKRGTKRT